MNQKKNKLNLNILDFHNKKYICESHGGNNISPHLKWNKINNSLCYALILEDPDSINGNFIHWYIPFISKNINQIHNLDMNVLNKFNIHNIKNNLDKSKINIIQGFNSLGKIGYHGPCAPKNSGIHRYIFTLFSLNNIIPNISNHLNIKNSLEFIDILNSNNIEILDVDKKILYYKFGSESLFQ